MSAAQTGDQIRRALTDRQWEDLRRADVSLLADFGKLVNLEKLKAAVLENTLSEQPMRTGRDDLEVVLHAAKAGEVIDWERHTDEVQFVFVPEGRLRVSIWDEEPHDTTIAFVFPGDRHRLEALTDAKYASLYLTVDEPETWCRER